MVLNLRKDKNNLFGFTEVFKQYKYLDAGTITIRCMATVGKPLADVFVYRGDEFLPLSVIEKEMGIEKYIGAKKPFYSVLTTGNVILEAKVGIELETHRYLPQKSVYNVYTLIPDSLVSSEGNDWSINLRRLTSVNDKLKDWFNEVGEQVCKTAYNRTEFLRARLGYVEEPEDEELVVNEDMEELGEREDT